MKLLLFILLNFSLQIFALENQQRNLTEIILNKLKQGNTIIDINLESNYSYFWDGNVVVENLIEFTLVGKNQTPVDCLDKQKHSLTIAYVTLVTIRDIIFEECNKHLIVHGQPPEDLAFLHFYKCGSVKVSKCKFKNVSGIDLLSKKTENLIVEESEFLIEDGGPSKAIMAFSNENKLYHSSLEVKKNVFKGMIWSVDYTDAQTKNENFTVECGSVLSVLYSTNGSSIIRISDNIFSSYNSSQGGAVCVLIGEYHTNSSITIERNFFTKGSVKNTKLGKKSHDNPSGGAIALFLYGNNTQLFISHCNFTENYSYRGGAVYIDYSVIPIINEIGHCRFENNCGKIGGALMVTSSLSPEGVYLDIFNSTFIGNTADFAGAILGFRVSINMNGSVTIAHNKAKGIGGGIGLIFSNLFVNGQLEVANNTALGCGGGIYLSSHCKIIMGQNGSELDITGNKAGTYGGGIYAYSLEYHNLFINWNATNRIRQWCFLLGIGEEKKMSTITLKENKAKNGTCAGDTGYTQMLGKCFDQNVIKGKIQSDTNNSCKYDTREMEFNIKITPQNNIRCNGDFFSNALDYFHIKHFKMKKYCEASGIVDQFVMENNHVTRETIVKLHKLHHKIEGFHYMYPGYVANITIWSRDFFNNSVATRANLSGWIFTDGQKSKIGYEHIIMSDNNAPQRSFLTNFSSLITMRSKWKGLGVICVESIGSFYKKSKCIGVIMGNCPPGFSLNKDQCECDPNKNWYSCTSGNNISVNYGYYIATKYVILTLKENVEGVKCLWSRCKCHYGAPKNDCLLNTLFPDDQCLPGLTGILCGNCSNRNKTLFFSPFLHTLQPFNGCNECRNPALMIVLVVLLIILVGFVIMLFRVNLFDDYWRSIIFYANISYLILVNSNLNTSKFINIVLAIPILPLNLLVTQMVPFCFPTERNMLYTALFDMTVPLVVLLLFFSLQRFLVTKVSWLSTRNVPTQIWSMLLLTYTDLSIHVFMILTCPVIGDNRHWLYQGHTICYQHLHLFATVTSLFYMFVLTSIPLFLLFIVFCTEKDFQFHYNITREFKHHFRWWEIYKLFLRLLIAFLLSYVSNFVDSGITNLIVSIICLFTMILNSLFQPANNVFSNHFESLCLLSLALTSVLKDQLIVNYTLVFPFLVGAALIVFQQKIFLWYGQIKKISAEFKKEKRFVDKVITMFKIWDVKNNYELDSM